MAMTFRRIDDEHAGLRDRAATATVMLRMEPMPEPVVRAAPGDVDDPSPAGLAHCPRDFLRAEEVAEHLQVDLRGQCLARDLGEHAGKSVNENRLGQASFSRCTSRTPAWR